MRNNTPLRYPGGKSKITSFISDIIEENNISENYVEPFAGGAGIAINLLLSGKVKDIYLNDSDISIYAFWYAILKYTNKFIDLVLNTNITVQEFLKQKNIQNNKNKVDLLTLGFSTFFLNRTTRSGILKAGVIGGYEQKGNYLIDARFNKIELINRIKNICKYKKHIHIFNKDAIDFLKHINKKLSPRKTLIYLDPPYYNKGKQLYVNFYNKADHVNLYRVVEKLPFFWIVSYDNAPDILEIYKKINSKYFFQLNYSLAAKRKGIEIFFFKDELKLPVSNKIYLSKI